MLSDVQVLLAELASTLGSYTYHPVDEAGLQAMVQEILLKHGLLCEREVIQGMNRYDIVVERSGVSVVLELKVKGTAPAVERQAQRYARTFGVDGVAVVTTSQRLARNLIDGGCRAMLGGKPFAVIPLRSL